MQAASDVFSIRHMSSETLRTYCPLCISRCGAIATIEDGRFKKLEHDPQHPTGSAFCIKGRAAPEMVYSEHRLTQPLRRVGPRGPAAQWQAVSWDEALQAITQQMAAIKHEAGAAAMVFGVTTPSGTAMADAFGWVHRLARAYGTPNVLFATENCNWHKDFTPQLTFGAGFGMPDLEKTGCLLLWGANPSASWLALAVEIKKAQKRGMKLVVIDPRNEGLARKADLWLRPRPGSDKALALGLAGELLRQGAIDREFLQRWSNGPYLVRCDTGELLLEQGTPWVWNEARHAPEPIDKAGHGDNSALEGRFVVETGAGPVVCRPAFDFYAENCLAMTLEKTEALTGVPAQEVCRAAEMIAKSGPLALYTWTGLCQHADATQTTRAVSLLYALSGDWEAPGGNVAFKKLPLNDIAGASLLTQQAYEETLGRAQRPLGPAGRGWISASDLAQALAQPRPAVKGVISFGGNWLATKPLPHDFAALLDKLDLFVMTEMFLAPTAQLADWVLPVASAWEREGLCPGFGISQTAESRLQLRPALAAPRGESRADRWIVFELARRLELAEHFWGGDGERALQYVLAPSGVTPQQLRDTPGGIDLALATAYYKYRESGFATPSGRVEIYSSTLQRQGYAAIPNISNASQESTWPLILVSVKVPASCHSQHRQLSGLRRHAPLPTVTLHPDTGAQWDLKEERWVAVVTAHGRMAAQLRFDAALAHGVAVCSYGWHEAAQPEVAQLLPPGSVLNFAVLSGSEADPVSGSNNLKSLPCRLEPLGV